MEVVEEEKAFEGRGEAKDSRVVLAEGADGRMCRDRWRDLDTNLVEEPELCVLAPDGS